MKEFDVKYKDQNVMNFWNAYNALFFHPFAKISQLAVTILTVILSIDRYIVIFYPYIIYR